MTMGRSDIMAQAVYLAQLESAKGDCQCRTCQILRKGSQAMTDQFLAGNPTNPGSKSEIIDLTPGSGGGG